MEDKERVVRRTLPTHSFTIKKSNFRFLEAEAARRNVSGPSAALREILDEAEERSPEIVTTDLDQKAA